ncbi:hypothetical protein K502DRAFT_345545 [Neoconidiobolus thromboides FSU 785]|nr:hypothetical protein K502DRAFT_345545 [Neoconidiobolus thromboides FSU 785]
MMEFIHSKIIFINEATFNVSTRLRERSTGRKTEKQDFRALMINTFMCCAMNLNGLIEYQSQLTCFFTNTFNQFVKSAVERLEKTNISEAIIIMDNVYIKKDSSVKGLIESKGHELIHSPPNSSFLNPVERIYTKWIQSIRAKEIKNEKELFKIIDNILSEISSGGCRYFFEQMLSFLSRCLNCEEIIE